MSYEQKYDMKGEQSYEPLFGEDFDSHDSKGLIPHITESSYFIS